MSNLIEIQNQIEKLSKQAEEIKTREFDSIVLDIQSKMKAFGITIKDIQPGKRQVRSGAKSKSAKPNVRMSGKPSTRDKKKGNGISVAPKFKGPNGEMWTGRGLTPRWLSELIAKGQSKEDFAIKVAQ